MFNISKFFTNGLQNTILVKNNTGLSYNGPWKQVYENTLIDKWHIGDLGSAEYTFFADLNTQNKEIVKCLLTATVDTANIVVYARNSTGTELIELKAFVNDSYVEVYVSPTEESLSGSKLVYTAQYFQNQNLL